MPNIASILKEEIACVARKEIRGEVAGLRKTSAAHRIEIVALKRRAEVLEKELRRITKAAQPSATVANSPSEPQIPCKSVRADLNLTPIPRCRSSRSAPQTCRSSPTSPSLVDVW